MGKNLIFKGSWKCSNPTTIESKIRSVRNFIIFSYNNFYIWLPPLLIFFIAKAIWIDIMNNLSFVIIYLSPDQITNKSSSETLFGFKNTKPKMTFDKVIYSEYDVVFRLVFYLLPVEFSSYWNSCFISFTKFVKFFDRWKNRTSKKEDQKHWKKRRKSRRLEG